MTAHGVPARFPSIPTASGGANPSRDDPGPFKDEITNANGGELLQPLWLPPLSKFSVSVPRPGSVDIESTPVLGKMLRDVFRLNADHQNFRIFSPDETSSNRLDPVWLEGYLLTGRHGLVSGRKKRDAAMADYGRGGAALFGRGRNMGVGLKPRRKGDEKRCWAARDAE